MVLTRRLVLGLEVLQYPDIWTDEVLRDDLSLGGG